MGWIMSLAWAPGCAGRPSSAYVPGLLQSAASRGLATSTSAAVRLGLHLHPRHESIPDAEVERAIGHMSRPGGPL